MYKDYLEKTFKYARNSSPPPQRNSETLGMNGGKESELFKKISTYLRHASSSDPYYQSLWEASYK
jgi:hypothetical protein